MAWGENGLEYKRNLFCRSILDGELKMSVACRQFQISRPTGYEWLSRYKKEGPDGLVNRSSSRLTQANKTPTDLEDCIILTKLEYKYFGPDKIYIKLKDCNTLLNIFDNLKMYDFDPLSVMLTFIPQAINGKNLTLSSIDRFVSDNKNGKELFKSNYMDELRNWGIDDVTPKKFKAHGSFNLKMFWEELIL